MGVLNFLAGLAEIILAIELVVLLLVIAAVCAGIWFGLRFAEKKATPAFDKANEYIAKGRAYEQKGLRIAAKPVIMLHAFGEQVGVTLTRLIDQAREERP
jgi:hypothetical protein